MIQLAERLARQGVKSHKERVEELNRYLSNLSEHHDMCVNLLLPSMSFPCAAAGLDACYLLLLLVVVSVLTAECVSCCRPKIGPG